MPSSPFASESFDSIPLSGSSPILPHVDDLDTAALRLAIQRHRQSRLPRFERLWSYYRNPLRPRTRALNGARGWYSLAQEAGLPSRITGRGPRASAHIHGDDRAATAREIVIENDIGWRIHSMVDFLFAKPVQIRSTARDPELAKTIESVLDAVWEASGGIALLQDIALLGHVYGHVDLVVRLTADEEPAPASDHASRAAAGVRIEPVEPRRGVPLLDAGDYRRILAYAVHFDRTIQHALPDGPHAPHAPHSAVDASLQADAPRHEQYTEIFTPHQRVLIHAGRLIESEPLDAFDGRIPVVHIQNMAQPFAFEGLSEVEPLIPLQDELNTRLSDRASRVTMQSFKMYLAKGIENFDQRAVAPGQIWSTSSPDASIAEFGGDADSPSEESHIREVREALDKISAVPPLASGVVRAKIGNLTSANALRITLMGLLSKTARKRVTYGGGIARASALVLAALDQMGILRTSPADRGVRLWWPDPLPEDMTERVRAAEAKARLGVPREQVIDELDESRGDAGVM